MGDMASQVGPYTTYGQVMAGVLVLMLALYACFHEQGLYPGIPAFGIDDKGWMRIEKARKRYMERGLQLVGEAIRQVTPQHCLPPPLAPCGPPSWLTGWY